MAIITKVVFSISRFGIERKEVIKSGVSRVWLILIADTWKDEHKQFYLQTTGGYGS